MGRWGKGWGIGEGKKAKGWGCGGGGKRNEKWGDERNGKLGWGMGRGDGWKGRGWGEGQAQVSAVYRASVRPHLHTHIISNNLSRKRVSCCQGGSSVPKVTKDGPTRGLRMVQDYPKKSQWELMGAQVRPGKSTKLARHDP